MARTVKDNRLGNPTVRAALKVQGKPHWRGIEEGLSIGYRRLKGRSGTWTARHYSGNGEYAYDVVGTADDRSDADGITVFSFDQATAKARALHTERAKRAAGIHGPLTVDQAMEAYCTHLDQAGKSTYGYSVERVTGKYISPLIGQFEVAKLTSEKLNKWKADIAAMPARGKRESDVVGRRATANRTLAILKAALNLAFKNEKVPSDKAWGENVEAFGGVARRRERFLSVEECKRLVNAADAEFRPMIQAALATGCRYGELCNLLVSDFHSDSSTLSIRHSKSGKGRSIYLTPEGVELFEALAAGRKGSDPLIRRDNGQPFDTAQQVRRMEATCKHARIDHAPFHCLRHSYASALVKAGTPLAYVAESLGHASIKMVQQHYGHIEASHLAQTIRQNVPTYGFAKTNIRAIRKLK
jgi:integrase